MIKNRHLTQRGAERFGALFGAAVFALPAAFLGIVVGGNIGGGYLGWAAQRLSLPTTPFVALGIAIGFCLVVAVVTAFAASAGRYLARVIWGLFSHDV